MIDADTYLKAAGGRGFDFYTGVPCSFLTPIINRVIGDPGCRYVGAASEGEAVAIAAGAWLADRQTTVMCQNSGLGNAVNPLTSLNHPFRIPTLLIVTWRGEPGIGDEPQHVLMGEITGPLLETVRVEHAPFPSDQDSVGEALDAALEVMDKTEFPFAFIMPKDSVCDSGLDLPDRTMPQPGAGDDFSEGGGRPQRVEILERFLSLVEDDAAVVASTGKCGRELFTLAERPQHLYQVGSMGCAGGMGLGVALNAVRPVVVLDGDGAVLMKMGTLATIGAEAPANLLHIVLDNGVHDSTGGQPTVSASVDFAAVARACGYAFTATCDSVAGFEQAYRRAAAGAGPSLLHVRIRPGSLAKLGRPTIAPPEVARRFRDFVVGG
ncbi:MAG: phosphonopyruvate decarboxylase [Alphaproteobacteria bacterium]|jgi:phosphonopyruvate decarboxylase|nr:phosphonopyruvate decarboxylase [Alphaproteobacteria bacterium]